MTDTPFPLGRRLEPNHDPRSFSFPAPAAAALRNAKHRLYGRPLDQGSLGSCTGNAAAHALNCAPFHQPRHRLYWEPTAVNFYSHATMIDPYDGTYPPEDTGSDGMSVLKVLKNLGKIGSYRHAFGLDHALHALVEGPWIMGVQWTQDMFQPDRRGFIYPTGAVAGGHEICANQLQVDLAYPGGGYVQGPQSWGKWGPIGGMWRLTFKDLGDLLARDGDVTVPLR